MISPKSHDEGCLTKSSVNSNNDLGIFKLDIVECETGKKFGPELRGLARNISRSHSIAQVYPAKRYYGEYGTDCSVYKYYQKSAKCKYCWPI